MTNPGMQQWLPRNEIEVEEYFSQLQRYGEWRLKNIKKKIDEFVEIGSNKVIAAEMQEKKAIEEVKAAEAEREAARRELEKLQAAGVVQQEERHKQMMASLAAKQLSVATAKKIVARLQTSLEEQEAEFKLQKDEYDEKVLALKTVGKLYSHNLLLKLQIDEESHIVTVIFQLLRESGEHGEFSVQLRETIKGVFKSVDPQPEIQTFADELDKSGNVSKFLYDVRKYAISVQK